MPTVPDYGGFNVQPTVGNDGRFDAPPNPVGAIGARQLQDAGAAVSQAGEVAGNVALDMQERANQVRLAAARNDANAAQLDLIYGQNGVLNQKGLAALQRDGGQDLASEYTAKLQDRLQSISANLTPAQQRAFMLESQQTVMGLRSTAEQHMHSEFVGYHASVADGTIALGHEKAIKGYNDPVQIADGLASVNQGIYDKGMLLGQSGSQIKSEQDQAVSRVHKDVILSALEHNDVDYASRYFQANGGKDGPMTGEDSLAVLGQMNSIMGAHIGMQVTSKTTADFSPNLATDPMTRLTNIVQGMESAWKDTNPDGTPLTSKAGAKYAMQVMPATAANPGHGIEPAKDDSPAEYNRVGRQVLSALVQKYQDIPKALAAYNWGEGNVDHAIATAGESGWQNAVPAETRAYIQKGMTQFGTGGGMPQRPTEMEFVQHGLEMLGPNPLPAVYQATREALTKQFAMIEKSRVENADRALNTVQQTLIGNGGNFNAIPPQQLDDLTRYDPQAYEKARTYAAAITHPPIDDMAAYNDVYENPAKYANMAPSEWAQYQMTHFTPRTAKMLEDHINPAIKGDSPNKGPGSIDGSLNGIINNRLVSLGLPVPKTGDTSSTGAQQYGRVKQFISESVYAAQASTGKKMTPKELSDHVDGLFAQNVEMKDHILGFIPWGTTQGPALQEIGKIPDIDRKRIIASFAKAGKTNPTPADIVSLYRLSQQ